jgi:hypothetical protein
MAYSADVSRDIFVTYAEEDNTTLPGGSQGWVTTLAECVSKLLGQTGLTDFGICTTPAGHLTAQDRVDSLRTAATVLVVMSPAYLQSQWQRDSRFAEGLVEVARNNPEAVFIVWKSHVAEREEPSQFRDLRHYKFWKLESEVPRTFGVPDLLCDTKNLNAYYGVVGDLAKTVAKVLNKKAGVADRRPICAASSGTKVYLANVPAELDEQRRIVRRQLEQIAVEVLPAGRLPESTADCERAIERRIGSCRMFVQLLSPNTKSMPGAAPGSMAIHQLAAARRFGSPTLQVMHWRDPAEDMSSITDAEYRTLLLAETVRAESLESFCQAVRSAALTTPQTERPSSGPMVFVDVKREQVSEARRIFGRYTGVKWDFHEVRPKMLKDILRVVKAAILFWGDGDSGPTQDRYYLFLRYWQALKKRDDNLRIYDGPPVDKPEFDGQNFPLISGRACENPDALTQFIAELAKDNK